MDNRAKPKIYIPVGCLMDIPTASIITGAKETLYNGGLGQVVSVVVGNNFKSTLIYYIPYQLLQHSRSWLKLIY